MEIKNQRGLGISSIEEWLLYAPPAKGDRHWVDGRSAKELAKAWFYSGEPRMPVELRQLLDSHEDTIGFIADKAIPEYETKLDSFKGSGRIHDLIVTGEGSGKSMLISIEAKVDESFGEIISKYLLKSVSNNTKTKIPERTEQLGLSIFGNKSIGHIRYQLLHAIAGTLIEAEKMNAAQAVFVIHEFVPFGKQSKKSKQNNEDLKIFVNLLTDMPHNIGQLIGPLKVIGGGNVSSNIPLYIGKIESKI
ncbi:DUF6946 family protein [Paenibacillus wynnii]|uniref:DUF6946 family protein n=1 Tax=Paenibacillus wynnii TaxID=268407 RepID=UPI0027939F20|nr:hypothetical protein [Paenibacillus wynnii]MDQ0191887.1 hypothetical protein [Paenibacillus wynnii]